MRSVVVLFFALSISAGGLLGCNDRTTELQAYDSSGGEESDDAGDDPIDMGSPDDMEQLQDMSTPEDMSSVDMTDDMAADMSSVDVSDSGPEIDQGPPPEEKVALGGFDEQMYYELPASGGTMEIISGFQGGWHVEPGLWVDDYYTKSELIDAEVSFVVRDPDTGDALTFPSTFLIYDGRVLQVDDGWVYHSSAVRFDVADSSEVEGLTVELEVEAKFGGRLGTQSLSKSVDLVDEIDELGM